MKRDMDLVRDILAVVEQATGAIDLVDIADSCKEHSSEVVAYHVELLNAHGLIDAKLQHTTLGLDGFVQGLTWDGADYLDAIRDQKVWKRVKEVVKQAVGSTTLSVIKQAACAVAEALIKRTIDGS